MPSIGTYVKAVTAGAALCIGGPALVYYITPTEEEIFKKYNPELQKRSLEQREQRQKEFDQFVTHLKEAAKSDKPIWAAQKDLDRARSDHAAQQRRDEQAHLAAEAEKRRAELRASTQ